MKTKILIFILIVGQFVFNAKKSNAQGCGDFFLAINSNSFNFNTRVGTVTWSNRIGLDEEQRVFCPIGWWQTPCTSPLPGTEKVTVQIYLNSTNTLNGSEILVATVANVGQNGGTISYIGDNCIRWLTKMAWDNVVTTYTLPASISACSFNSTYRYVIAKTTLASNSSITATAYDATPAMSTSLLGDSPLCTSGTYNNTYSVTSTNMTLSGIFNYTSSNPSWPINGLGTSLSTTATTVSLTVPVGASSTTLCVSGGNLCGTICKTINGVANVPAQPSLVTFSQAGASCSFTGSFPAVPTATGYDWSTNSSFSPIEFSSISPQSNAGYFDANTTYTLFVRAKNVCGNSAYRETVKKTGNPTGCLQRVASTDSTAAIEQVTTQQKFSVFPNPASSNFEINISNKNSGVVYLKITNIEGRLVKEISTTDATINISTVDMPAGLYYITLNGENFNAGSKIQVIK